MILQYYGPYIKQIGKKYVRIAAVDASLIKLSLAAFSWATYREKTGAAKITCVLDSRQRRAAAIRLYRLGQSSRPEGDSDSELERGLDLLVRSRLFLVRPADGVAGAPGRIS